jgi:SAM-dependent methyltransferase
VLSVLLVSDGCYAFGEDADEERERLMALERAIDVHSQNVLVEVGVRAGWRCWEVGAGRGSIARWLSGIVGSGGEVLATDLSDRWFDPAGAEVKFQVNDVVRDPPPGSGFDLVHARFLLEHVVDPSSVISRLAGALRPGGVLVLEDSAGLALEVSPSARVFERFVPAWEQAAHAVGWNPGYGGQLMSDLRITGMRELKGHQYRQLAPGGPSWTHIDRGIRRLEGNLVEQGVALEELTEVLRCLADPKNLIIGPPVTIAWATPAGDDV